MHQLHQLFAFVDDGSTITPSKNGSKKTCNFYVLFFSEKMWNANRVVFDERRFIVLIDFTV
jgi:hypothetical protein